MRRLNRREMLGHIPSYPGACSIFNLAAHLGYVDKDMDAAEIASVLSKMEKKLFWRFVTDERLVGAEMKTQRSTRLTLTSKFGFEDRLIPETNIYLSMDRVAK